MYTIRRATPEDALSLGTIHALSWKKAYKGIIPDEILFQITPEKRAHFFDKALNLQWEEDYLLQVESEPAGLLCIGKNRDDDVDDFVGEIWGIYLHPDFIQQGYGRILMDFALSELKERGYTKVTLWVLKNNRKARFFYEKMGFQPDGKEKEIFIGKALEEIRYYKIL
jgi:ribosomal protein S18 acetylase RimI-like enzyme